MRRSKCTAIGATGRKNKSRKRLPPSDRLAASFQRALAGASAGQMARERRGRITASYKAGRKPGFAGATHQSKEPKTRLECEPRLRLKPKVATQRGPVEVRAKLACRESARACIGLPLTPPMTPSSSLSLSLSLSPSLMSTGRFVCEPP